MAGSPDLVAAAWRSSDGRHCNRKGSRTAPDLAKSKPRPLAVDQTFDGHFDPDVRFPAWMQAVREFSKCLPRPVASGDAMVASLDKLKEQLQSSNSASDRANTMIVPAPWTPDKFESLEIEREIWRDRLQVMQRSAPTKDRTIAAQIDIFLSTKEQEAGANSVSVSRLYSLRLHLTGFASWIGGGTAVDKISGTDLINYRLQLLKKVAEGELARTTASDRLSSVKSFVRWLWQSEAIENLPRVMHPRSKLLEIGKSSKDILTFTEAEIAKLLRASVGADSAVHSNDPEHGDDSERHLGPLVRGGRLGAGSHQSEAIQDPQIGECSHRQLPVMA